MKATSLPFWGNPNQLLSKKMQFQLFPGGNYIQPSNCKSTVLGDLLCYWFRWETWNLALLLMRAAWEDLYLKYRYCKWKLHTLSSLPWEDSENSSKQLPVRYRECRFWWHLGAGAELEGKALLPLLWLYFLHWGITTNWIQVALRSSTENRVPVFIRESNSFILPTQNDSSLTVLTVRIENT